MDLLNYTQTLYVIVNFIMHSVLTVSLYCEWIQKFLYKVCKLVFKKVIVWYLHNSRVKQKRWCMWDHKACVNGRVCVHIVHWENLAPLYHEPTLRSYDIHIFSFVFGLYLDLTHLQKDSRCFTPEVRRNLVLWPVSFSHVRRGKHIYFRKCLIRYSLMLIVLFVQLMCLCA